MHYVFQQQFNIGMVAASPVLAVIIDPEAEISTLYSRHLENAGVVSAIFHSFNDSTFAHIIEHHPHVLIINQELLNTGGFMSLERLRSLHPEMVLITVGEHVTEEVMDRLMELGVSCHINRVYTKPEDISVTVLELLGARL
jgi:DNA-binding NtrC family response regulator